ncbi:shikimate dehydrogenase [Benzoatithermus flavus]|uniref:Shikimate dehydrogenase (NADP(+)) n=1 Tax=Benzoatithermus flavus TaxID=3108223 RepID=A0ABU8XZK8_9PROT
MLLSGKARLAGVMGWPVGHSLSPRLHGHWFERYRIDGTYVPLPVRPEDVALAFQALPRLGFLGWNVTVPHKEAAFRLVDEHDPAAARIGAVNTVLVQPDGRLLGLNTDGAGFLAHLRATAPSWTPAAGPVALLGAGGAARGIAVALLEAGVPSLRLTNRTPERAAALAEELARLGRGVELLPWAAREGAFLEGAALLVNATSLGMAGQPPLELSLTVLPRAAVVADIVYVPLETALLRAARRRGHVAVDGLGMLLHQAVPGFSHWGGVVPVVDEALRAAVLAGLAGG